MAAQPDRVPSAEDDPMLARARDLAAGAGFCALGITVPILFHVMGVGRVFLPMHLPLLLGGLFLSPGMALLVGCATPWAAMLFTGMPPLPMAIIMSAELAVLSGSASLGRRAGLPLWAAVWTAIALRVLVTFVLTTALARVLNLPPAGVGLASVAAGIPGIILQAVLVPASAYPLFMRQPAQRA